MKNITEFHVPENPRARTDNLRVSIDKAKKYDDLQTHIAQNISSLENELRALEESQGTLKIGYNNGFRDGSINVYQKFLGLLRYFQE